jgi:hypothetical protein
MSRATYETLLAAEYGGRVLLVVLLAAVIFIALRAIAVVRTFGRGGLLVLRAAAAASIVLLAALAIVLGGLYTADHHIGAPPDPYPGVGVPCPPGSHYVHFWEKGTWPRNGGVIDYLWHTEIASCGASLHISTTRNDRSD